MSAAIKSLYGDRLDRLVLFGSRARGDHAPDSDYDVAVFVHDVTDYLLERARVLPVTVDLLYSNLVTIHPIVFDAEEFSQTRQPIIHEIRREGLAL